MTEEQISKLPAFIQPYASTIEWVTTVIHTIGLPWAIILLSAYYGIPFAKDTLTTVKGVSETMKTMSEKLDGVSSKVDAAVSGLHGIQRVNMAGNQQRHTDFVESNESK